MIKKVTIFAICFMLIISALNLNYAADYRSSIDLSKIISVFNNCDKVKEYQEKDIVVKATRESNVLYITIVQNEETKTLEFEVDGNVLFIASEITSENYKDIEMAKEIWDVMVDCIKQIPGYKIINNRIEVPEPDEQGILICSVQISDINDYITIQDLDDLSKTIAGDGVATIFTADVGAYKGEDGDKKKILLAEDLPEDYENSQKTYKSLMSIVQVMFGSEKAVDYFKQNYTSITDGIKDANGTITKEFEGVKIEKNPKIRDEEVDILTNFLGKRESFNFVRVTIDKNIVNAKINGNSSNNNSNDNNNNINTNTLVNDNQNNNTNNNTNNTQYKGNLPKTGEEIITIVMISGIVILLGVMIIGARKYKDIK